MRPVHVVHLDGRTEDGNRAAGLGDGTWRYMYQFQARMTAKINLLMSSNRGAGSMREEVPDQVFVEHPHSSPNLKHPEG